MKTIEKRPLSVKRRIAIIGLCVVLMTVGVVSGVLAWLSSNFQVTNMFSSSNLEIDLAETTTAYKMIPNTPIAKDPQVTVFAQSEPSYLFLRANESPAFSDYADYYVHNDWQQYGGFVVDGKLDSFYKQIDGWYFNSTSTTYTGLEAYYSDASYHSGNVSKAYYKGDEDYALSYQSLNRAITNGVDADKAQLATEVYVAYDHDYVYVYAKLYDNDYYLNGGVYNGGNHSDYFGIFWDPDPKSYENVEYGEYPEIFTDTVINTNSENNLTYQKTVPTHGEAEVKLFPYKDGNGKNHMECQPATSKIGYGSGKDVVQGTVYDYFKQQGANADTEKPNCVFFEFKEDINGVVSQVNGKDVMAGYGFEFRLPRNDSYYDTIDGKPYFKLSIAATSYNETFSDQMTLAFGQAYWLWYDSMMSFPLDDENSPFAAANTGIYYKTMGRVDDGPLTETVTIPILRSGSVYGSKFADGYVYVRDDATVEMLNGLTTENSNVKLQFEVCAIQQFHMDLEQAYNEAVKIFDQN